MDQLYTYEILQELRNYDCYDFFKDIIWPTAITAITIASAMYIARSGFRWTMDQERKKEKRVTNQIKNFIISSFEKEINEFKPVFNDLSKVENADIDSIPSLTRHTIYSSTFKKILEIDVVELSSAIEAMPGMTAHIGGIADFISLLTDFNQHLLYANNAQSEFYNDNRVLADHLYQSKIELLTVIEHNLRSGNEAVQIDKTALRGLYLEFNRRRENHFQQMASSVQSSEQTRTSDDLIYLDLAVGVIETVSAPDKYISNLYVAAATVVTNIERIRFALKTFQNKITPVVERVNGMVNVLEEFSTRNR